MAQDNLVATLTPLEGYALISPHHENKQSHGIIVKRDRDDYYIRGTVVAVGTSITIWEGANLRQIDSPCKVGDTVLYSSSGYETITEQGREIQVVKFSSIVGVYK